MADLIDKMKAALNPAFLIPTDKGIIRIVENEAQAKNRGFNIGANLPHLAFTLDRKPVKGPLHAVFPPLNPECSGICSVADSIIVCRDNDDSEKQCAFVVELKSGDRGKALKQIRSSRAFIRWLVELLTIHHGNRTELQCFGLVVTARKIPLKGTCRIEKLNFSKLGKSSSQIHVAEWDHSNPLHLSQMLAAAFKS
jgi:hypothetical protein